MTSGARRGLGGALVGIGSVSILDSAEAFALCPCGLGGSTLIFGVLMLVLEGRNATASPASAGPASPGLREPGNPGTRSEALPSVPAGGLARVGEDHLVVLGAFPDGAVGDGGQHRGDDRFVVLGAFPLGTPTAGGTPDVLDR